MCVCVCIELGLSRMPEECVRPLSKKRREEVKEARLHSAEEAPRREVTFLSKSASVKLAVR